MDRQRFPRNQPRSQLGQFPFRFGSEITVEILRDEADVNTSHFRATVAALVEPALQRMPLSSQFAGVAPLDVVLTQGSSDPSLQNLLSNKQEDEEEIYWKGMDDLDDWDSFPTDESF